MSQRSVHFAGANLRYTISGEGMPVVLIHGFAEDGRIWDQQVDELSGHYQFIVPDLPGSGGSSMPGNFARLEDHAAGIKAILDHEKIDACVMIGHSMGGYITLAFAESYPNMLKAYGLFHSSAYADDEEKKVMRRKGIEFIQNNGAEAFLKTSIPGLFRDAVKSRAAIDTLLEQGRSFAASSLVQYYEAMIARPDRTALLKTLDIPLLMLIGKYDKAVPFHLSMQQTHLASCTYIHILHESAHMGMLEEPGLSTQILAVFLENSRSFF